MALFILTFIFVEETSYDRKAQVHAELQSGESSSNIAEKTTPGNTREQIVTPSTSAPLATVPQRKSFVKQLAPWGRVDHSIPYFMTMARSFTYFFVPQVLWVITCYGIYIGLCAFGFNYTFPIKITSPPYNWTEVSLAELYDYKYTPNY